MFFAALWELVPESMEPLAAVSMLFSMDVGRGHGTNSELAELILARWGEKYRLTDLTSSYPHRYLPRTPRYLTRFPPANVYEGRDRRRDIAALDRGAAKLPEQSPDVTENGMIRGSDSYAVLIAHLLYEDPEGRTESQVDAEIGDFDPRAEKIEQAISRLLPELKTRLRYALQNIVEQDAAIGDGRAARGLPSRRRFEWTVRYQVIGESLGHIATSEGFGETRPVSKAVKSVAELIGLNLREHDQGGRPPKQVPVRRSHCIAIRHAGKTHVPGNGHNT
jgi:hypothetical protein